MRTIKLLTIAILFLLVMSVQAQQGKIITRTILDDVTTTATSSSYEMFYTKKSFQLYGATASGAGTATAFIQMSNDDTNWSTVDTLSLTLSATASTDYFETDAPWKYTRGVLNTITGTGATVSLVSGEQSRF